MARIQEAGTFEGTIVEHYLGTSKKGSPYVALVFDSDGDEITGRFFLTDKAMRITLKRLPNVGWTGTDVTELGKPFEFEMAKDKEKNLRGVEVEFCVEQDGEYYNVVDFWLKGAARVSGGKPKAMEGAALEHLAKLSKAMVKDMKKE